MLRRKYTLESMCQSHFKKATAREGEGKRQIERGREGGVMDAWTDENNVGEAPVREAWL